MEGEKVDTIGSSPRVRGTPSPVPVAKPGHRFIPACAGNASGAFASRLASPVHPRVCGERRDNWLIQDLSGGSSPRVRGTRSSRGLEQWRFRFIPACAGNACRATTSRTCNSVHPRVCGERSVSSRRRSTLIGSSPRVRGTRGESSDAAFTTAVHPRVCGERGIGALSGTYTAGSSPRVRGTHTGDRT